jgi:hypothetical protein
MIHALILAAGVVVPPATPLSVFEFKGALADTENPDANGFGPCSKAARGPEVVYCSHYRPEPIAGVTADWIMLMLYQNRMTAVAGAFRSNDFGTILGAFNAKYGQPCKTEESEWRSVAGFKVPNVTVSWCFASGTLSLARVGSKLGRGSFNYEDNWRAPARPATVDF